MHLGNIGNIAPVQIADAHRTESAGPRLIDQRIDANAKVLTTDERVALTAVADLQGETPGHTYTRYGLTKFVTEYHGRAFTGGVQVHDVGDYLRALESSANMKGGRDIYGVTAEEYGRLVEVFA